MNKSNRIRITQHSERRGVARHNDRHFDVSHAGHIDSERMDMNEYCSFVHPELGDFEQAEFQYYRDTYLQGIHLTNEKYIRERHPDRCRTVEDVYRARRTRPEEVIIQIGDRDSRNDPDVVAAAMHDYLEDLVRNECLYGYKVLNYAIHRDESSVHCHIRRVWEYADPHGVTRIGQDKALKQHGVGLPDPDQPRGRYNNRKQSFDRIQRERWMQICEKHGLEVEREPMPGRKHLEKEEYIISRIVAAEVKLAELEETRASLLEENERLRAFNQVIGADPFELTAQVEELNLSLAASRSEADTLRITAAELMERANTAEASLSEAQAREHDLVLGLQRSGMTLSEISEAMTAGEAPLDIAEQFCLEQGVDIGEIAKQCLEEKEKRKERRHERQSLDDDFFRDFLS